MRKKIFSILSSLFLLFFPLLYVIAADLRDAKDYLEETGMFGGYDIKKDSIDPVISTIISIALSFLGVLFLLLMIYGGFLWMTAKGNEEQVTKAKNLITAAIIGLIIVVAAYAISVFVVSNISAPLLAV